MGLQGDDLDGVLEVVAVNVRCVKWMGCRGAGCDRGADVAAHEGVYF